MKWFEIKIITTSEASDAVSEMLSSLGAGGVSIEDPRDILSQLDNPDSLDFADEEFMNSLGDDVTTKAYFSSESHGEGLTELVKEKLAYITTFLDTGKGFSGISVVDDEDWATAWKKYYKPFKLTGTIVVRPSWEEYNAQDGETVIELDPGMAFGTGTHETTRLCAGLIEKYINRNDRVLDLGCGTGILSIVAAKLGASSVLAADIDEMAVRITRENAAINREEHVITGTKGILQDLKPVAYDIIVANIIADVIIGLSGRISLYLRQGGFFISSGIIRERHDEVIAAYTKNGLSYVETLIEGEWVAIVFICQGSL